MTDFTPDQVAFAKSLLGFGGMLRLPVANRDPADLIPLNYEATEVVATFHDHCNLGNLALPKERWKEFAKQTREVTDGWIEANGLERHVQAQCSYRADLEYGDIWVARMVIVAKSPCALKVPALHDSWWDELKGKMKKYSQRPSSN